MPTEEIFTKLKYLAAIIFGLFGLMLALAAGAFAHELRGRNRLLQALRSQLFEFKEDAATGAWTWVIRQGALSGAGGLEAEEAIGHHSGPLAALAKVMGAPAIRLRVALPESWIPGQLGARARGGCSSPPHLPLPKGQFARPALPDC